MGSNQSSMHGIMAQFREPDELVNAVRKARKFGYNKLDTYTPFAVDGLVDELDQKDNRVPKLVFGFGMLGAACGFLLQVYASCYDYPLNIGGRPDFSWPSFIPITFETGVVFASFAAVFGMFALNDLPRFHHPVFGMDGFERATDDRFFLCVDATDPNFDVVKTRAFLEGLGAESVVEVSNE